jgi:hypothetical protein
MYGCEIKNEYLGPITFRSRAEEDGDIGYAPGADPTPDPENQSRRREPMQTISLLLALGLVSP